jgi:predicted DNA-binding ribbon-helix-helix protein
MNAEANTLGPSNDGNSSLARWVEPQFRVVTTGSRRRGVRLERVFWKLLDEIAERRGLKRSKLIGGVLEDAGENTESVASILRCFAASTIDLERSALLGRLNPSHTIALMQQAPMPAFSINRQKKLQQVNAEFMQLLRPLGDVAGTRATAEFVHLALDTPIDELFAAASAAPSTQCNYTLQVDDRRRRGRAKVVLVPSERPDTLVGYVLP